MELLFDPIRTPAIRSNALKEEGSALAGKEVCGPNGLLSHLAIHLGLKPEGASHAIRIEQYRKALEEHLREEPEAFYAASFEADPVAVARVLLRWRDELKWAEWGFEAGENTPSRLRTLAGVEMLIQDPNKEGVDLEQGIADRWVKVKEELANGSMPPFENLHCTLPFRFAPPFFQRLLELLKEKGCEVQYREEQEDPVAPKDSDLGRFQHFLKERKGEGSAGSVTYQGDGSLLLLEGDTEREMAQFLVASIKNEKEREKIPLVIEGKGKKATLSEELTRNGMPGIGESMDRSGAPVPQLFFLTSQLVWKPMDPDRMMEFLTLQRNPLPRKLCSELAKALAEKPGRGSKEWREAIDKQVLEWQELHGKKEKDKLQERIELWLDHELYDEKEGVPVRVPDERFQALRQWLMPQLEDDPHRDPEGFGTLHKMINGFLELLGQRPGSEELSRTLVEKWVDEVQQKEEIEWESSRAGSFPVVSSGTSLQVPVPVVLNWGFIRSPEEGVVKRDQLREDELEYLKEKGVRKEHPEDRSKRETWIMEHEFFTASEQLILCAPARIDGEEMAPHPFLGDLESSSEDISPLCVELREGIFPALQGFDKPPTENFSPSGLPEPVHYWELQNAPSVRDREKESHSGLEALFFHPHEWMLRYQARIRQGTLYKTPDMRRLEGNLAHRFAEKLFGNGRDLEEWDEESIQEAVDEGLDELLTQEGAFFLMPGYRNRKEVFHRKLKEAMTALYLSLHQSGWSVKEMEAVHEGSFNEVPVEATIDMVLEKGGRSGLMDLKLSGNLSGILEKEEELQLVLYASILSGEGPLLPTAYFNLERGRMVTRYAEDFPGATFIHPLRDEESGEDIPKGILERMNKTYRFRMEELRSGKVELGYELELGDLDAYHEMDGQELLAFKTQGSKKDPRKEPPKGNEYANLIRIH